MLNCSEVRSSVGTRHDEFHDYSGDTKDGIVNIDCRGDDSNGYTVQVIGKGIGLGVFGQSITIICPNASYGEQIINTYYGGEFSIAVVFGGSVAYFNSNSGSCAMIGLTLGAGISAQSLEMTINPADS